MHLTRHSALILSGATPGGFLKEPELPRLPLKLKISPTKSKKDSKLDSKMSFGQSLHVSKGERISV